MAGHGELAISGVLFLVRREEHVQHFQVILRPLALQEADELAGERAQVKELEARLDLLGYGDGDKSLSGFSDCS